MPSFDDSELLDALSAPIGDLISSVGRSVAVAQLEMDRASIAALQELYGSDEDLARMLQGIGYRPTWYHIPEVETELTVALTVTGERSEAGATANRVSKAPVKMYAAPVDATYTNKYAFQLQAASRVRFKVVPVPPSVAADQMTVVPQLVGMSHADARALLMQLNIPLNPPDSVDDEAVVQSQEPPAGSVVARGGAVSLTFPKKKKGKLGTLITTPITKK